MFARFCLQGLVCKVNLCALAWEVLFVSRCGLPELDVKFWLVRLGLQGLDSKAWFSLKCLICEVWFASLV